MRVTLKEIADRKGVTWHAVRKRKLKEDWQACGTRLVNHKPAKEFETNTLPDDIKLLFLNSGFQDVIDGGATQPPCGPSATSSSDQEQRRDLPSDQLAPAQVLRPAPAHPFTANESGTRSSASLKKWQRDVMTARLRVLAEVERLTSEPEISTTAKAIMRFLALNAAGSLSESITQMITASNHRKGTGRTLTKGTIYRWMRDRKQQGDIGLAPADKEDLTVPSWGREFLALWRMPSKPTIPQVIEMMAERAPAYGQAIRFLRKFSRIDAQRGRMSGSELRSIRGYTRRDKSNLMPLDGVVADGHSFKAKVAHPVHGRPHHPEVEAIIDLATRVCIGWSAGLAESSHIVADALRYAVTVNEKKSLGGVPAIFYSDRGSGNKAHMISHETLGILARIGTTIKDGIPGNPQGRGVIERMQASLWVRAAKELPTYTGKDMDTLAQRRIMKFVNKDIATRGTSDLLITWSKFLHFCEVKVAEYNNRQHHALPKITDPATGLRRHATPTEMWRAFVAEGWQPMMLSNDEIKDLFHPQIKAACRRAQVTVFRNIYYHKQLEHYHGEDVIVCYDVHDAKTVQVRDCEQRLICEAVWNANKRDFFPMPVIEQARQKRMEGKLKRLEDKARTARQEARGVIEGNGDDLEFLRAIAPPESEELNTVLTEHDLDEQEAVAMNVSDESASERREFRIVSLKNNSEDEAILRTGTDDTELRPIRRTTTRVSQTRGLGRGNIVHEKKIFRAGMLAVDLNRKVVKVGNIVIDCLPQEFRLISLLIMHRGRVFSRKELLRAISRSSSDERVCDVCVRRLRARLERVGAERAILSKKGHGYYFSEVDL